MRAMQNWPAYLCLFASDSAKAQLLSEAEQNRLDKQPGATSNSSGTTSLASKGSSPSLLGFALEHGGLTQSTDGNTITFRGNLANSIRALLNSSYLGSYELGESDPLVIYLAKLSFALSFDTSSNQQSMSQGFSPSSRNLSGFSLKYEIFNQRDPRNKKWRDAFRNLADTVGKPYANSVRDLDRVIFTSPQFRQWEAAVQKDIYGLPANPSDEDIQRVVRNSVESFEQLFASMPEMKSAASHAVADLAAYLKKKDEILANIRKTFMVTVEYNHTRQLVTNSQSITATQPNQQIPDLSNINLVLEKGIKNVNAPEFTLNVGATWFNSSDPANAKRGRVRDYRASAEVDVPLREITNIGRPVLSFSGQFLALLEEPLGQKVMLNGVTIDRRGNIAVFQTKVSIPVKDSGVKIPISFTYASRTELIKEKDARGNIGITFDFDSLFSKPK